MQTHKMDKFDYLHFEINQEKKNSDICDEALR